MTKSIAPPVKVDVLVYSGVELLDFSGPTEVFSNVPGVQDQLVSMDDKALATKGHTLHLTANYTLALPPPDILPSGITISTTTTKMGKAATAS
jgi:hypothetical protein